MWSEPVCDTRCGGVGVWLACIWWRAKKASILVRAMGGLTRENTETTTGVVLNVCGGTDVGHPWSIHRRRIEGVEIHPVFAECWVCVGHTICFISIVNTLHLMTIHIIT